ncbi:MAG: VCBS repeat-containing protein [Phycisphaerae bacterium]|nr:VCBS repeat-containing protein [Phycisphaerae bacterium]
MRYGKITKGLALAALAALAGSASAGVSFGPRTDIAAAQRPSSSVVADLNGDGLRDLAVTTDTPDKVLIYLNTGAGLGAPATLLTGAGSGPDSIAAGDLDGDGDQDLVVVLKNIGTIRAYMNTGGVFAAGASGAVGADPRAMIVTDVNGDHRPDFITSNRDSNDLSIASWNGAGFSVSSVATGQEPYGVAAGDFNADGKVDLAATNHRDRNVSLFTGNGAGGFAAAGTLNVGNPYRPDGVVFVDIERDGDMDLAVVASDNAVANQVFVFRNTAGAFGAPTLSPTGGMNSGQVVAADLDRDGDSDLAVLNVDSATLSILENLGGALGAPVTLTTGATPSHLALGNLVGSPSAELVVTGRDSNVVSIYENLTPPCPADVNEDGFVNGNDFDQFASWFDAGSALSDFNGDGFVNGNDYDEFAQAFDLGC